MKSTDSGNPWDEKPKWSVRILARPATKRRLRTLPSVITVLVNTGVTRIGYLADHDRLECMIQLNALAKTLLALAILGFVVRGARAGDVQRQVERHQDLSAQTAFAVAAGSREQGRSRAGWSCRVLSDSDLGKRIWISLPYRQPW